jgi:hypothetical protein
MSVCFHPHLFDAEKFHASLEDDACDDATAMALIDSFDAASVLDGVLTAEERSDVFAGRCHPESRDYLGGVVDAVRAGLARRSKAARLLAHASCLEGRFSDVEPAMGYLEPREVDELATELEKVRLEVGGLEADRLLLMKLLGAARERGRGLAFMAL